MVIATFGRACGGGFVNYDDEAYVTLNAQVAGGLTGPGLSWALTATEAANWHPLTWLSLQADATLYGLDAWGYHLTNVLLHAATTCLVFGFLWSVTNRPWPAALAAGLFGLHPLRVESVAWVAERKDVLSGLLFALTLWAYARYAAMPTTGRYADVLCAFGLGLLAKPMLVTLPCVLLLLDYWPLARWQTRRDGRRLVLEKLPQFALVAVSCVVTVVAQAHGRAVLDTQQAPLAPRLGNAILSYVRYLVKLIVPVDLAPFYPYPQPTNFVRDALFAAVCLAVVTVAALWLRRRAPYVLVGWLWFLGMLVPVIGLVQVGQQSMADRYSYLPSIGLAIAVAWGLADLVDGRRLWAGAGVLAASGCLAAGAVLSWKQVSYWHDSEELWQHTLAATGDNFMAEYELGLFAAQRAGGETATSRRALLQAAIDRYRQSLRLQPSQAETHYALARALAEIGSVVEAEAEYRQAIRCNPRYAEAYTNLGIICQAQGRVDEGMEYFGRALEIDPSQPEANYNVGATFLANGRPGDAVRYLEIAVRGRPESAAVHRALGLALQGIGETGRAAWHLREAHRLEGGR